MSDCAKHGPYIDNGGHPCPVCEGRSSGRTWMTVRGRHFLRARAEATANPNEDDPYVTPLDRYAPELDRAWRGEEA